MTIKDIREQLCLTQTEFAEKLGTSQVTVSRWEIGAVKPGIDYLRKIAKLGACSIEDIGATATASKEKKNATVIDAYEAKYGNLAERGALYMLGGDPAPIIANYESRLDQPDTLAEMMGIPPTTAEDIADGLHHAIREAIELAYFGKFDRLTARAIYTALCTAPHGKLTVWKDMEYNNLTFATAWQSAHPDQRPLTDEDTEYFV